MVADRYSEGMTSTTTERPVMPPTITVTDVGNGAHRMTCSCGEAVTYAGKAFTDVEAMRHARWHRKNPS